MTKEIVELEAGIERYLERRMADTVRELRRMLNDEELRAVLAALETIELVKQHDPALVGQGRYVLQKLQSALREEQWEDLWVTERTQEQVEAFLR